MWNPYTYLLSMSFEEIKQPLVDELGTLQKQHEALEKKMEKEFAWFEKRIEQLESR